jgi:hypothetical protein
MIDKQSCHEDSRSPSLKAHYSEFETAIEVNVCASIFQRAVDKRPLKLKAARFKYFTPTRGDDPFAQLNDAVQTDFEAGTSYEMAELFGSVIMGCCALQGGRTLVTLRSTGNMRGRLFTNSLVKHIVSTFQQHDSSIVVDTSSGRI